MRVIEDGIQLAEFDIRITGPVGTTTFTWLIECRDRPSEGPSPRAWIEQLIGRRDVFNFNKVTAVSTTGFAQGAYQLAKARGIELRAVAQLSPEKFDWVAIPPEMTLLDRRHKITQIEIFIDARTAPDLQVACSQVIARGGRYLSSVASGEVHAPDEAFMGIAKDNPELWHSNKNPDVIEALIDFPNDKDHYVIETKAGRVRILAIGFVGVTTTTETRLPLTDRFEYKNGESGQMFSQVAVFAPGRVKDATLTLELYRKPGSVETHVLVRHKPTDSD